MLLRAVRSAWDQTLPPVDVLTWTDIERRGHAYARNTLLAAVTTPLVAFFDDDDEMLPDHLEQLDHALEDDRYATLAWSPPEVVGADYEASFIETGWLAFTHDLRTVGGWRDPVPGSWAGHYSDYDLLLRLIMAGHSFTKVPTPTWRRYIHSSNTQGTKPFRLERDMIK